MPNATVRANARTLPEATNCRAVLRGMLTAGGVGAASALTTFAAAAEDPSHPDAEIFALIERCRKADGRLNASSAKKEDIIWAKVGPTRLRAAETWTEADALLWPDLTLGKSANWHELQALKACLVPNFWGKPGCPPEAFADQTREIVATREHFTAELEKAKAHWEVLDADAETTIHFNEWHEAALLLAETRAKAVDGVMENLMMVAADNDLTEDDVEGSYDGIITSAALDAVALNGRAV